jgi:hypothetical protein
MYGILIVLVVRIIEYIISIPKNMTNWFDVRIFRKHNKRITSGTLQNKSKIAIMAVFSGTTPHQSVGRIINSLQTELFSVIVVLNENAETEEFLAQIKDLKILIIRRPNIGGDFGAYKSGIQYISENNLLESLHELILINDSIFVTNRTSQSISKIAKSKNDTNCIFYHRQGVAHAASMYLKFTNEILQKLEFQEFWRNYYPYRSKRKIIRKGEHKLTRVIGHQYFKPLVTANAVIPRENGFFEKDEVFQVFSWSQRVKNSEKSLQIALENEDFQFIFNYAAFNFQVSNSLGLFVNRIFDIPLKMDLVKNGLTTPFAYLNRARADGCSESEINKLEEILDKKGAYTEGSPLKLFTS